MELVVRAIFGGQMYDAATDQAMVNSPGMIRAYEWVQSFPQRWGLENLRRFKGRWSITLRRTTNFFSGRLATTLRDRVAKFMQEEMGDNLMDYAAAAPSGSLRARCGQPSWIHRV